MAFGTQQLDYYLTLEEIKQLGSNFHKKQEYIDNDELIRRFGPNKVRDAAGDRMFASLSQVNYSGGYYADHEERPTESKKNPADSTPEDEKFETDFIKKPFEVLDDIHSILKTNLQILEGQPEDHHRDQDFLEDVFFKHIKIPRKEKYQQLLKGILHKPHLRDLIDHTLKQIESFMMPPATEPENLDVFWIVYLDYLISLDIWDLNIYQTAGEKVSAKNNKEENPESIILRKRAGFLNFCAHYRRDKLEDNYSFKLFILQHFEIGRIIDPDTWFKFLDISPVLIEEAIKKFIERFLQEKDIHYKVFQKKLHELFKTLPDYNIKQLFSDIETPSEIKSKNQVGVVAGNIDHASRLSAGIQESKTENNRHSGCHLERCSTGMTDIYKNPNQDAKRPVELKSATMHPAPPIKEKKVELTWPEVKATLDPVERELGQIFAELKELWKRRNYVKSFITPQSRSFIKEEYQLSSQSIRYAILKKLCRNGDFMIECWETKLRSISQSDKNALSTTISYLDDFLAGFNKFFDTDLDKFMEVILPELENLHNQYLFNPSLTMDDLRKIFFERVFYTIREQDLLTLKTQFRIGTPLTVSPVENIEIQALLSQSNSPSSDRKAEPVSQEPTGLAWLINKVAGFFQGVAELFKRFFCCVPTSEPSPSRAGRSQPSEPKPILKPSTNYIIRTIKSVLPKRNNRVRFNLTPEEIPLPSYNENDFSPAPRVEPDSPSVTRDEFNPNLRAFR